MDPKTKQLVEACERNYQYGRRDDDPISESYSDVQNLCSAVREQDRRAQRAEVERDAFGERIKELETQLREAVELAAETVPYVSDYFRDKYEMNDRLAKLTSDSPSPK